MRPSSGMVSILVRHHHGDGRFRRVHVECATGGNQLHKPGAAVSHVVASFSRATSRVDSGWMNANGLTILDLARMEVSFSLLLDEPTRGAATHQPDAVASAIDAYVQSLKPVPSPHLVEGRLSKAAKRGQKIFRQAGCADCHVPGLFTDLHAYDVGTRRTFDRPADNFYTPTLIEVWRTAPYLHDGSAATLRDVLTTRNPKGEHGAVSGLSNRELDDLCEYVLSL